MTRVFSLIAVLALVVGTAGPRAQTPPPASDDVWTIDTSHSSAQFATRHLMVSTVRGTLGPVKGTVKWDGKNVNTAQVEAVIDVAGLSTQNQKRDDHLRSNDFFDAANHPTITFKSKRVDPAGDGRFKLVGDLTIRGNTHEVALDVEGPTAPQKVRNGLRTGATATGKISRKQFGLLYSAVMETGGAVVGDDVQMTIDVELIKQVPTSTPQ
jgi:polyisoprenoid-binding protein YceI